MLAREVAHALYGTWRLAHLDPTGLVFFDRTLGGFWRSWWALAFMWPAGVVLTGVVRPELLVEHGIGRVALVHLVGVVVFTAAYALLIRRLALLLGFADRLFDFLVVYNWAQVLGGALMMAAAALWQSGIVPGEAGLFLLRVLFFAWYVFNGYIAYQALGAGLPIAVATVVIDYVLSDILFFTMKALY
jgi:hypothetical protein